MASDSGTSRSGECIHPLLVRVVGPSWDALTKNPVYKCESCRELLVVTIKPFRITVREGNPGASNS